MASGVVYPTGEVSVSFTSQSPVSTINNFTAKIIDGYLIINYNLLLSSASSNNWYTLGTLSVHPSATGTRQTSVKSADGSYGGMVEVNTSGQFRLYAKQSYSNNAVEGLYICKV